MRKQRRALSRDQVEQVTHLVATRLVHAGFNLSSPDQLKRLEDGVVGLTVTISAPGLGSLSPISLTGRLQELQHEAVASQEDTLICGGLALDCRRRLVTLDGELLALTPRELQLLIFLMRNPDTVLTRSQLLGSVWELSYDGDIRTVDTHVKCLRRKLGPYSRHIVTVRKVGYRFDSKPAPEKEDN